MDIESTELHISAFGFAVKLLENQGIEFDYEILGEVCKESIVEAMQYCHRSDYPKNMYPAIARMTAYKMCQPNMGTIQSENYSGASFNYLTDYPETIYNTLNCFRKLRCL